MSIHNNHPDFRVNMPVMLQCEAKIKLRTLFHTTMCGMEYSVETEEWIESTLIRMPYGSRKSIVLCMFSKTDDAYNWTLSDYRTGLNLIDLDMLRSMKKHAKVPSKLEMARDAFELLIEFSEGAERFDEIMSEVPILNHDVI